MIRFLISLIIFGLPLLFVTGVVFAQEPDIEININETISVGDSKNSERDSLKEEIHVNDTLISENDTETELINLVDEMDVEVSGEPIVVETPVILEDKSVENNSLESTDLNGLEETDKTNIESSTSQQEPSEETIKDSGRKIKVSSGSSKDSGADSSSIDTDADVEKEVTQNIEPDELSDVDTAEIGQESIIDVNTNTQSKDKEASSSLVSDSEVNGATSGSCSSTQNQGVDASIIAMSMIWVPIVFRRLRHYK